jgi:hypothetical protein
MINSKTPANLGATVALLNDQFHGVDLELFGVGLSVSLCTHWTPPFRLSHSWQGVGSF